MEIMDTVKKILKQKTSMIIIALIIATQLLLHYFLEKPETIEAINSLKEINTLSYLAMISIYLNYLFKYVEKTLLEGDPFINGIYGKSSFLSVALSYIILIKINLLSVDVIKYLIEFY